MSKETIILNDIYVYEIEDIKEGGMGRVLILNRISDARELDFIHTKQIAAKTFKDDDYVEVNKQLFERELNIWLNFDENFFANSNVVKLLRTAFIKRKLFALMPLYDCSVRDLIEDRIKLDLETSKSIILDATIGVSSIFKKYGIVHQDLKPENILVKHGYDNKVQYHVSDWGIANIQRSYCPQIPTKEWLPSSFIEVMSQAGTLPYMSPERLLGYPSMIQFDIYSIGIIFFELLFGHLPFDFTLSKPLESQILEFDYYYIAHTFLKDNFNDNIQNIILKCINPDYNKRHKNYKTLMKDIKKLSKRKLFF